MRIAIWWQQESWGGVDTHLLTLLRNWPNQTDQFVIFYNQDNQGIERIFDDLSKMNQVTLHPFNGSKSVKHSNFLKVFRYFSLPIRFVQMKRKAKKILLAQGHFDVFFADNGGYPGSWGCLAALWAAKIIGFNVRLLLIHHEAMARGPFRKTFESLLDLGVQYWSTDIVAVSRATRSTMIERRGFYTSTINPIRVIHNGLDLSNNDQIVDFNLRKNLKIPEDNFIVGIIGRIERYKGHEDIILALDEMLIKQREKITLVFIGGYEANERQRLEAIANKLGIESNIKYSGYINLDIKLIMRQINLLAMLTKDFEGFGLTIAEAMQEGTLVLTTNVGAVPEYVKTDFAYMINPEAPDEIANALIKIQDDNITNKKMTERAQEHIKKYSGKKMAKKFHRLMLVSEMSASK